MEKIMPKIFLIGETRVVEDGLQAYLDHIGASDWKTDANSDAEEIAEIYGRLCYRSFEAGLNPNVTRVREGNKKYLDHVIQVMHGSICEHSVLNFILADVSRVVTHELVRHRAGVAISQESLRFVRLDRLKAYVPIVISENDEAMEIFVDTFETLEKLQLKLAQIYELDKEGTDFDYKKEVTSAMRRIAPLGLATTIGWSANFRTIRHVIEMRTDPSAEVEIRYVFGRVAELCIDRYPNFFGDYEVEIVKGLPWYKAGCRKI